MTEVWCYLRRESDLQRFPEPGERIDIHFSITAGKFASYVKDPSVNLEMLESTTPVSALSGPRYVFVGGYYTVRRVEEQRNDPDTVRVDLEMHE